MRGSRAETVGTHLAHDVPALVEPEPTHMRAPTAKPSFEGRSAQLELQVAETSCDCLCPLADLEADPAMCSAHRRGRCGASLSVSTFRPSMEWVPEKAFFWC